ncbi:MAG TPA: PIN domain-containing protein [Caldilineaceae bacterium]|nr:PIN domain-containing protein [Caldilineaceae bacterium]
MGDDSEPANQKYSVSVAKNVIRALLLLPNVAKIEVFYHWFLIASDADDNKFVDCAVAANAEFIVTTDKHFDVLAKIDFPRVNVVTLHQFPTLLKSTNPAFFPEE